MIAEQGQNQQGLVYFTAACSLLPRFSVCLAKIQIFKVKVSFDKNQVRLLRRLMFIARLGNEHQLVHMALYSLIITFEGKDLVRMRGMKCLR